MTCRRAAGEWSSCARWTAPACTLDGLQDSGALSSLARADALVVRPAHAPETPQANLFQSTCCKIEGIA